VSASLAPQSKRILCVTVNAALDVTYSAESLVTGDVNRVEHRQTHAGGKGVNVARLLDNRGQNTSVLGFAGGRVGAEIIASLGEAGLRHRMVPCEEDSRRTVTVVNTVEGASTGLYERGPNISTTEWDAFTASYEAELGSACLAVLAGSLPPGVPADAYRQLTAMARMREIPVIVDAPGKPLLHALDAGPTVVSPNETELAEAVDVARPIPLGVAVDAARTLIARGAARAVVTLGTRGLITVHDDTAWLISTPTVNGNPVGAGDAVVAVVAEGEISGRPWLETLRRAAATAAAAVRAPFAGTVEQHDVNDLLDQVEVQKL
jgi:tagatose 6-phosphate kinase